MNLVLCHEIADFRVKKAWNIKYETNFRVLHIKSEISMFVCISKFSFITKNVDKENEMARAKFSFRHKMQGMSCEGACVCVWNPFWKVCGMCVRATQKTVTTHTLIKWNAPKLEYFGMFPSWLNKFNFKWLVLSPK